MKPKDIMDALNDIDYDMVEEAAPKGRKKVWVRWAAACLALVILGCGAAFFLRPDETHTVSLGGVERRYSDGSVMVRETALIFPWEYQTMDERYNGMRFEGREYRGRCREISEALLGETLGTCQARGYDIYTDQEYQDSFEVREIAGVDASLLLAVKLDGGYYVFMEDSYAGGMTFGAFLDGLDLAATLPLTRFTQYAGHTAGETYRLPAGADEAIWEILSQCREAEFVEDGFSGNDGESIGFTVTSEALGIYKKVFDVTRDGYVETNILDWGYAWYIGAEAAGQIIDYALGQGEPAEPEPYSYRLVGTVTEVREDCFLVDDGVLMADPEEGMIFRVPTDDLRISRWLDFGGIGVGDIICVDYTGGIDIDDRSTVIGAYSVSEAVLADGDILIPE